MKPLLATIFFSVAIAAQCEYVRSAQSKIDEASQAALWEENLSKAESLDAHAKFKALWLGLRNMGFRASTGNHSAAIDEIFKKIQDEYLSTPGHAQFFVDEIERERAAIDPRERSSSLHYFRCKCIEETLVHLPSPETVKVLGNFLSDERDHIPPYISGDEYMSGSPANSRLACSSLSMMGLRNTGLRPASESAFVRDEDLANARAWWEEVKSGKRTFSFIGQAVEYRFKPDGTWDTIPIANPPDDGPKPMIAMVSPTPVPEPPSAAVRPVYGSWAWILIGTMGALALLVWLGLRKSSTRIPRKK